jgi:hypothetical protein
MSERIVSPGVFTKEVDQSFLAGGIAAIGASIVGSTTKGPALIPTQITSFGEYQQIFGTYTNDSYVPFIVNDYLRNGNVITVTRLLYEDGYKLTNGAVAIIAESGSVKVVTHVLHPTQYISSVGASNIFDNLQTSNVGSGSVGIILSGSYNKDTSLPGAKPFLTPLASSVTCSINALSSNYVTTVFGRSAKSADYPVYVQYENNNATALFNNIGDVTTTAVAISNYEFLQDYQTSSTPFITSQTINGSSKQLFKIHTISHGTNTNHELKIGIKDIRLASEISDPNGYGTFTVQVRRVNTIAAGFFNDTPYSSADTDTLTETIEEFTNCNLDPNSTNYIARKIGNKLTTINDSGDIVTTGDYLNKSKYIRVEVDPAVQSQANDKILMPFGFEAPVSPIPMASASINLAAVSYKTDQLKGTSYNANVYYGFDYTNYNNLNYIAATPTSGSTTGSNTAFYLGTQTQDAAAGYPSLTTAYSGSLQAALESNSFSTNIKLSTRKFMVPLQGGFDGARPNLPKLGGADIKGTNVFGFDCSGPQTTGTKSYLKAFSLLSNADYYDMNLLITPGLIDNIHSNVTSAARTFAQNRQDTFYVMDIAGLTDSLSEVVDTATVIDNNYVASYWPWIQILNPVNNTPVWVPPSVVVPGVLSFNDAVSAPWYAPAGLNRGGLTGVISTYANLSQAQRDTLYEARVNPIANFPNQGICIWGQKTLQALPSALDRVNVRRLLIAVKKFIASSTKYLVFEQNSNQTRNRFLGIVNPYMEQVQANQGLYAFRVIMDATNNTPDVIDRNILYGQIFLQPTRTAEFIVLDFNIQATGAAFPD